MSSVGRTTTVKTRVGGKGLPVKSTTFKSVRKQRVSERLNYRLYVPRIVV